MQRHILIAQDLKLEVIRTAAVIAGLLLAALHPINATAKEHLFVAASVGRATLSENFDGFDIDTESTAYRVAIGWRFSDYFSLDAGYQNFGRFEQTFETASGVAEVSVKADGFTLGGAGNLPLGERVALFARVGAFFWDGDADINDLSAATPGDTNAYFGVGARFRMTDSLALTIDGSRYDLDGSTSTVFSVGVQYGF